MRGREESGVRLVEGDAELFRVIHRLIDAASAISINFEALVEGSTCHDATLVEDTREAVDRLVTLARRAWELQRAEPNERDAEAAR